MATAAAQRLDVVYGCRPTSTAIARTCTPSSTASTAGDALHADAEAEAVWHGRRMADVVLIKTLLYTGVRVSELVAIRLSEVDLDRCQIRVTAGKGQQDRIVPFPAAFKEVLALHLEGMTTRGASHLFESSWKQPYSDRGVRKLLARYAAAAGLPHPLSPHQLRHFLLTWLKKQGIDDALIQPYSGHASRQSLEIYSRLAIGEAQAEYDQVIGRFPV